MRRGKMKALSTVATTVVFSAGLLLVSASPAVAQLRQTPFPDGTGSIGLASGWHIDNSYRGSVTCVGPNGALVVMGMPWTIQIPGTSLDTLPSAGQLPRARVGDIIGALREVLGKRAGAILRSVRGNPAAQLSPNVPAYYLLYEFEQNGRAMTGLGYFTTLSYGPSSPGWQLYSSGVAAPREQFSQMLQTMLLMWRTWRPNGRPPREGSSSALFERILQDSQISHERISREFRELL